jgi:hypothetical protein
MLTLLALIVLPYQQPDVYQEPQTSAPVCVEYCIQEPIQ